MGVIPNLIEKMANSPALLHGYLAADGALSKGTSSVEERQLILLAASVENECQYCVAAHTTSVKHFGAQSAVIAAVKQESRTGANKLGALIVLPPRWPAAREDPR